MSTVSIVSGIPKHTAPIAASSSPVPAALPAARPTDDGFIFHTAKVSVLVTAKCGCICEFIKIGFGGKHTQIATCSNHSGRIDDIERVASTAAKSVLSPWRD